jgi:photosystem II stability/assembly factor-like uncharacterized protein
MKKNLALIMVAALWLPALVLPGNAQRKARAVSDRSESRIENKANDPDMPSKGGASRINKKDYLWQRERHNEILRGTGDDPTGARRDRALAQMNQQEQQLRLQRESAAGSPDASLTESSRIWTPVGPDPIPNGNVQGGQAPTSGRTVSIAVHPSNPNIVYFGSASGGVYRTLNGGQTYTQLMDTAVTQNIGFVAIAPSDPSTVFVGTGEGGFCLDCFFGRGIYRIRNADSDAPVLEGPFNTNSSNANVFIGRGISAVAVDPNNPNNVYVTTTSGFSGIDGNVFNANPTRGLYRSTNALAVSPTFDKVSITGTVGLGNRVMSDVVYEPGSSDNLILYAYGDVNGVNTDGGVYRSTNATAATPTFTKTLAVGNNTQDTNLRGELTINKVGATATLYLATGETPATAACVTAGQSGVLRRSTDGGATWSTPIAGGDGFCGGQCFYDIAVAVSPTDPLNVILGGNVASTCSKSVGRSIDGGNTFLNRGNGVHADQQEVVFAPSDASIVYEGNDGGIFKSTDGGVNFSSINRKGYLVTQFESVAVHPTDRNFTIGGTQDNGTEFLKPGHIWTNADGGDGGYARIDQSAGTDLENVTMYHTYFNAQNAQIGFARIEKTSCAVSGQWTFHGIYGGAVDPNTYCDGTHDTFWPALPLSGENVNFYAPMELGPVGSATDGVHSTVYFATNQLYRSADRGDTATEVSQNIAGDAISSIGISPQNDNVRMVGTNLGKVLVTTTGANPLTDVTPTGNTKYVSRVVVDPNNANTAYVTVTGYGVAAGKHIYKTTSLSTVTAATWVSSSNGIPDNPVNGFVVDPANSNNLYAGTDLGVYRSTDAGANWTPFSTGLPKVPVFELAIQNNNRILRAATHGRGIWEIKLNPVVARVADFNGDGRTDFSVERPSEGNWYILNSSYSITDPYTVTATTFPGASGDKLVPGDYDGDGKTDLAVFRPSNGTWRIHYSGGAADSIISYGASTDKPVQADYDGDGKTDLAVYRPDSPAAGQGTFIVQYSSDNSLHFQPWGASTDRTVVGDYDGDGKADYAVFRPADGTWYILKSSCNYGCYDSMVWGFGSDLLVPGDYDGDGKFDIAVFRPSDGYWYVYRSGTGTYSATPWGTVTDTPVPGDYDGDGLTDIAVWRSSTGEWFVLKSGDQALRGLIWGQTGDIPVPSTYIPQQ